jgi:hypothetical protein
MSKKIFIKELTISVTCETATLEGEEDHAAEIIDDAVTNFYYRIKESIEDEMLGIGLSVEVEIK